MKYTEMMKSVGDEVPCQAIIASIEKRWANTDQEPFIASVLLNPLLKTIPFHSHSSFSLMSINHLMQSLFTPFFPDEAAPWLFGSLSDYIEGRGEFHLMTDLIKSAESTHEVGDCHRHIYHADIK